MMNLIFQVYSRKNNFKMWNILQVLMLFINILRFLLFKEMVGSWLDMIVVLQIQAVFPLLAISFPVVWKLLNLYGSAKVLVTFKNLKTRELLNLPRSSFNSWKEVITSFVDLLLGEPENLPRTSNIVQSLGNLTSFCCIDKKGILSWPNPSAEKLFFLTSTKNRPALKSPDSFIHHNAIKLAQALSKTEKLEESCSACQVLNLTQDTKNYNGLFFDDFTWKNHISSLKPLGLSILLNTCNLKTTEKYTEFADHVKCMSLKQKEAVPVVNRRCFCELARQMGFTDHATEIFSTEDCFGIYQHDTSCTENKELIHREKYKMPMPNVFCVMVKDSSTDTKQLFSQGMADLLLSMCTDYWDGSEIKPLGNSERKKIADFYHRNSMTSYCTAFSYRPFNSDAPLMSGKSYLEVSENLFGSLRHLETSFLNGDFQRKSSSTGCWDSISNMSLQSDVGSDNTSNIPLKYLGNQIFVGMVTMQYQAKQEVVNLIERLELSCIRFVHFSKENELRSRGFSEKMGLEAGWNCHVSLLEEHGEVPACSESTFFRQKLCGNAKSFGSAPTLKVETSSKIEKLESPEEIMSSMLKSNIHHGASKSLLLRKPSLNFRSLNCNLQVGPKLKKQKKKLSSEVDGVHPLIKEQKDEASSSSSSSLYSSYIEGLSEIQNRAQLPKGIENIRPHINDIDNVPLQVSLFTDCTTSTTCEMLEILQEYGEVTCCLGSSLNIDNLSMFLKADCSVSKDPVFPQICNQQSTESASFNSADAMSPMQLSSKMLSLPCFLMFHQMDISCFHKLISVARAHCQRIRTTARLFLLFQLFLSFLQLFNSLSFLPPCLSPQLVLWLSVVVVPMFSLSMIGNPSFPQVTPTVQGKNHRKVFNQWMRMEIVNFCIRYLLTILVVLVIHAINLYEFCCNQGSTSCDCHIFFGKSKNQSEVSSGDWNGWMSEETLVMSQHFTCLQIVLYFALISLCNVHRYSYLWKSSPLRNRTWIIVALMLISIQVTWFVTLLSSLSGNFSVKLISLAGWVLSIFWIFLLICLHEIVKKREIKVWIRHQKRARLDFGTKLGMNSPF